MEYNIEDLAISHYNAGNMCKGCFVKFISPRDMNYKCPIHDLEVKK